MVRTNEEGLLEFVGRTDHQIKWMGYRIESADIEQTICAMPNVSAALVMIVDDLPNDAADLLAMVEADSSVTSDSVIAYMKQRLPSYMIPTKVKVVSSLPRSDRGKLDRRAVADNWNTNSS